jgi:kumamolisin
MSNTNRVKLSGSERAPIHGATINGAIDPHELVEISVVLKHRQPLTTSPHLSGNVAEHAEQPVKHLSRSEFADQHGANPSDIELIKKFAREHNLQVLERGNEVSRRILTVVGTVGAMESAFSVELREYEHPEGTYRGRVGAIEVPAEIEGCVQGIFGLDDRPVALPYLHLRRDRGAFGARSTSVSYSPEAVAEAYAFPAGSGAATGQTIGIIELGGGYRPADLKTYFKSLKLTNPKIKTVSVDHGKNRPTTANSADGEVMLDIEVAAAVAQGAHIVVYFTPNTDKGFMDALSTAIHDQLNNPSVISISWGGPESSWTTAAMTAMDQIAAEAALLGVTITVASGDNGSSDGATDGKNHVDFPASSPHVLACGGTNLQATGTKIHSETVWNDGSQGGASGGGISTQFARPSWQSAVVTQSFRGVPDVAGDADPESGYNVRVDGQDMVVGGTSAVAPLWAGLIAVLNHKLGRRLGFINPQLYAMNQSAGFHDITKGNNGSFDARPGWDACTGLGSPDGAGLLHALQTAKATTKDETVKKA